MKLLKEECERYGADPRGSLLERRVPVLTQPFGMSDSSKDPTPWDCVLYLL